MIGAQALRARSPIKTGPTCRLEPLSRSPCAQRPAPCAGPLRIEPILKGRLEKVCHLGVVVDLGARARKNGIDNADAFLVVLGLAMVLQSLC